MKCLKYQNILFKKLKNLGAIKWHNNSQSAYIKFKDVRLGSIRISDHNARERYSYTYELFYNNGVEENQIKEIVEKITEKSKTLKGFKADKYLVFDYRENHYKRVKTYEEYRNYILRKN